jgi:hypothetical protein
MSIQRYQPGGRVQIDWANPITAGLAFAYVHGDGAYGFCANGSASVPYTAATAKEMPAGLGARSNSSTSRIYSIAGHGLTTTSYSLFAVASATSTSATQNAIDADNSSPRYFQFRLNAGKVDFIPFNTSAAVTGQPVFSTAMTSAELARGFTMGATASPTRTAAFQNGQIATATPSSLISPTQGLPLSIGVRATGTMGGWNTGAIQMVAGWSRTLSDAEMVSLSSNPWQLFLPQEDELEAPTAAPSGITADIAWTEADDAVSLAGTLTDSASLGWTEANDTHAAAVTLTDRASTSWTEADDAVSITANIANGTVSGSIAWTEADDGVSVTVTANDRASMSWTEQDDVVAMSGNVATPAIPVTADIGWTEQDDGFSAFMQVATGGAPGYEVKRKRYVVRKGGQLLVFTDPELAKQALHADEEPEPRQYPAKKQAKVAPKPEPKPEPVPEQRVDLDELRALAEKQHAEAEYKRLLAQKQYETMLTLLERLREEEEDDWLLMSAD